LAATALTVGMGDIGDGFTSNALLEMASFCQTAGRREDVASLRHLNCTIDRIVSTAKRLNEIGFVLPK
jgi:hypothetical protein